MPVSLQHSDQEPIRPTIPSALPEEMRFAPDAGNRTVKGSSTPSVLIGGSPLRLIAMRPKLQDVVTSLQNGESIQQVAESTRSSTTAIRQVANRLLDAGMLHPRPDRRRTSETATVTLVIPVYNRAAALARLVTALGPLGFPVMVVDDGSTDNSGEIAARFGATVIRNDAPSGPAAARNTGLAHVHTPLVAFLDSDCVANPDWLDSLLPHFQDPNVALVAARIVALKQPVDLKHSVDLKQSGQPQEPSLDQPPIGQGRSQRPTAESAIGTYEHVRSALDLGPAEGPVVPRSRIAYVPAAALVGRTEVLKSFGGFETSMPVGEDVDLVWRLHENGWRVRYEPQSTVQHDHRVTLRSFVRRRFDYGTSAARLHARHPGSVPPVAVSSWTAATWVLAVVGGRRGVLAGLAAVGVSTALLPKKLGMLEKPGAEAVRLAGRGHAAGGRLLASALWRTWLPVGLVLAIVSRRARWILLASAIIPNLMDWKERSSTLGPVPFVALRLAEDAAYCAGVWQGCVTEGSFGALLPDLTSWPGKRPVREDDAGDSVSAR